MNERIRELAEQASVIRKTFHGVERITFDKQKFAELIVQECVWQVVKDNEVPQNIQVLIGERFKQHFGVK